MDYSGLSYLQKLTEAKTLLQQLALMTYPRHQNRPDINLMERRDTQEKIDLAVRIIERLEGRVNDG